MCESGFRTGREAVEDLEAELVIGGIESAASVGRNGTVRFAPAAARLRSRLLGAAGRLRAWTGRSRDGRVPRAIVRGGQDVGVLSPWRSRLPERLAQSLLAFVVERGLGSPRHRIREMRGSTLSGVLSRTSTTTGRAVVLQLGAEVLHELVVGADVGQRAGRCAGAGADRHPEQGRQEQQARSSPPHSAPPAAPMPAGLVVWCSLILLAVGACGARPRQDPRARSTSPS